MKKYAIIAAGGAGVRMGNAVPKQFLILQGKPILWHSVKVFTDAFQDINIIVVAPASHLEAAKITCGEFSNILFAEGGKSRFQSVKNGLSKVEADSIVFVHDAVRCLITKELIRNCYQQAVDKGSAIPTIAVNDSIRMMEALEHKVIDRNLVRVVQTPQTFQSSIIIPAFAVEEKSEFTDEATVVEASGKKVHLIEGEHTNIKITRPLDLLVAEKILEERLLLQKI